MRKYDILFLPYVYFFCQYYLKSIPSSCLFLLTHIIISIKWKLDKIRFIMLILIIFSIFFMILSYYFDKEKGITGLGMLSVAVSFFCYLSALLIYIHSFITKPLYISIKNNGFTDKNTIAISTIFLIILCTIFYAIL